MVGNFSELTCSTKSSSVPDYYARLFPLSYTWFVNNAELIGETRETLRFLVTREHIYNQFSCSARDKQQISARSDSIRINPLYKPDKVTITPQPSLNANDKLAVKEGGTVGPYNCSADCNPPCDITWKYKDSEKRFYDALSESGMLVAQKVNRSMTAIRCSARYQPNIEELENINLDVQYLDGLQLFVNESRVPYSNQAVVQANEKTSFRLSCNVNGNPNPSIGLRRNASTGNIDEEFNTEWLNYTINSLQCTDTDMYTCVGKSMEFSDKITSIQVNVKCEPRFDDSVIFKSYYGSMSGADVEVIVAVPVIANPSPQGSDFTWSGPTGNMNINSIISQQIVFYKHLVESSMTIRDRQYFGNYTMMYKGKSITTVVIYAEDIPKPPVNFTGYSYAPGLINLTWISGFNGGSEQFFILSTNNGSAWEEVANISDPGEGRIGYFNPGPLVPGQTYRYRLKSCNRINCSLQSLDVRVTFVKELKLENGNDRPCIAFYGLLAPLILSLLCNVWCIIREIRRKFPHHRRKQNKENENENEKSYPNTAQDPGHVYDDLKANSDYQELGEASKPSIYDKLK